MNPDLVNCCTFIEEKSASALFFQYSTLKCPDDPLENLEVFAEQKPYRMNRVVFAEPLELCTETIRNQINGDASKVSKHDVEVDTVTIENVSIIKRKGKRKKYSINMDQTKITCPQQQCQKSFSTTTLLRAHIRKVHCSNKDFVCEQCGAGFTAQYLLNRHYEVHSKEKIQCPVCCKMLSKRTNLGVHLRSHADTRPHECAVCHKRFLRRSTLNVHLNVHREGKEQARSTAVLNTEKA